MSAPEGSAQTHFDTALRHAVEGGLEEARRQLQLAKTLDRSGSLPNWRHAVVCCLISLRERDPAAARQYAESAATVPEGQRLLRQALDRASGTVPPRSLELVGDLALDPSETRRWFSKIHAIRVVVLVCVLVGVSIGGGFYWMSGGPRSQGGAPATQPTGNRGRSSGIPNYRKMQKNVGLVLLELVVRRADYTEQKIQIPIGSAFVANRDGLLLTNAHVVKAGPDAQKHPIILDYQFLVAFGEDPNERFRAEIYHRSDSVDAAVLRVKHRFEDALSFARQYNEGDNVFAFGFPGAATQLYTGLNPSKTRDRIKEMIEARKDQEDYSLTFSGNFKLNMFRGSVSAIRTTENGKFVQTDAVIHKGMSGGPLVNRDGDVVGIVTAKHQEAEGLGLALSWHSLKDHLSHIRGFNWKRP